MLRLSPRVVIGCQPLRVSSPKHAGWRVQHVEPAWCANAHWQFGRTSRPGSPATGQRHHWKGCSGRRQFPCRALDGYGSAVPTRGATDIRARELQSRGCSVALLYNHFRPHSSLGYQTPASYAGTIAATGSNAARDESFAFPPVATTAPLGVFKTAGALTAAG